jgi:2-polyprenyl-3-methyl-5-hydroxy-6-metoxy-1,4-benzoquinol methylase
VLQQGETLRVRLRQDRGQLHWAAAGPGAAGRPRHAHVPRWHFDMVQDAQRNAAYERAIARMVGLQRAAGAQEVSVLDIGAGSGILSLMAAR